MTHERPPKTGQRWQVETVNRMIKRLLGSALRARLYWQHCREITLRALTFNAMRPCVNSQVFYGAFPMPFLVPLRIFSYPPVGALLWLPRPHSLESQHRPKRGMRGIKSL